jgi:hypothetical protein
MSTPKPFKEARLGLHTSSSRRYTWLSMQVLIKRRKRGRGGVDSWEVVRARGHLDEVQELKSGEAAQALAQGRPSKDSMQLVLTEGAVLGGGAFSRVSIVTGHTPSLHCFTLT